MKKAFFTITISFLVLFTSTLGKAADPDKPFKQAVSVKYKLPESLQGALLKKVVVDYDDIVYVLTDRGLYRTYDNVLAKDLRYTPLAQRVPIDIAVQEGSGYLYYLYEDEFLTNAHAGIPRGEFVEGRYKHIAVAADGNVLLVGANQFALFKKGKLTDIGTMEEKLIAVHAYGDNFYGLSNTAVYRFLGGEFSKLHEGDGLKAIAFRGQEIILGTDSGYYGIDLNTGEATFPLQTRVPVPEINNLLVVQGNLWAGTPMGAFMEEPDGNFRYYASKRWLNEDKVIGMAANSQGDVYLLTPSGLNKIDFITQTLAEKAAYFQHKIRQRHIRYGFISNVRLGTPGDITTSEMVDTDNDGLWSSFYLGSQAFRYAVTGEEKAKRYAWETFEAFERLLSINQLKGFPSRTFERKGFKNSDPERWRDSPDPGWEWKGHTSSDEFVGHMFVAAIMDEFVAETKEEKKRVADFIDKIMTHIIENDYYFVDIDGKPTLWARWNPEYRNWYPKTIMDRKLGSTTILTGLQLAYSLTGKEIYKKEVLRLINDHSYLENMLVDCNNIKYTTGYVFKGHVMGTEWNHSDDEMAFLTYWVLYRYALNDELKQQYATVIKDHWEIELPERNALWNLITLGTEGSFDKESTFWWLREFPMDLVRWTVHNSHRKDIVMLEPNFRSQYTKELLPAGERPIERHNANPFELDGGNEGKSELGGGAFLLPYWMGRYLSVFETINKNQGT